MRFGIVWIGLSASMAFGQGHVEATKSSATKLAFLVGAWTGRQNFNNPNGKPMVATVTTTIAPVVGGRFLQETINGVLPGRPAFQTVHMMTCDDATGECRAWWFNDTSRGPSEYVGKVDGDVLTMTSVAKSEGAPKLRVTYAKVAGHGLKYRLEMQQGSDWTKLFETDY